MKTGKIYIITNLLNGKYYVGQTTESKPLRRWQHHRRGYTKSVISEAIVEYGEESFVFEIVAETPDISTLNDLERLWILVTRSTDAENGYNVTRGGQNYTRKEIYNAAHSRRMKGRPAWNKGLKGVTVGWNKGLKMSEEFRKQLSESHKGKKQSPELVQKRMESKRGFKHSLESRRKMSEVCQGRKPCAEATRRSSELRKGKPAWNSGKKGYQVAWNKGLPATEEQRKRLSEMSKGRTMSSEAKAKISAALKGRMPKVNTMGLVPWNKGMRRGTTKLLNEASQ